jgi:hypothetical protein
MNSEALLGPLSAVGSDAVWGYQIRKIQDSNDLVFTNGEEMTQNDPRLGPLPEGWRKRYLSKAKRRYYHGEFENDGTMRRLLFKDLSTNKTTKRDPRMTSTALKERGVVFEDIIII